MERKKYLLLVFLFFIFNNSFGESKLIYQAYISGRMDKWKNVIDSIEVIKNKSNSEKLELIDYYYGYIAWCISQKKTKDAELYVKKSELLFKQLEQEKYNLPLVFAYKSAFVGFKMGIAPYKAPFLGQESLAYAQKSVSMDSLNSLGFVQLGNIAYFTPKMFGGSKTDALKHYQKALKLMETQKHNLDSNWNYLNLVAIIIKACIELKQVELAKYYCKKILAVEPNFDWVKNKLYPQLLKAN